jgi:predicted Zn-dependent protease
MRPNLRILVVLLTFCAVIVGTINSGEKSTLKLPEPKFSVVLNPFGGFDPDLLKETANYLEAKTGVRPTTYFIDEYVYERNNPDCFDKNRGQWDADKLVTFATPREGAVAIQLMSQSLYTTSQPKWVYCFGVQTSRAAVLSSYNMNPANYGEPPNPALTQDRLNKMVLRYVLELAYDMDRVSDPRSVLRSDILGPSDIDAIVVE